MLHHPSTASIDALSNYHRENATITQNTLESFVDFWATTNLCNLSHYTQCIASQGNCSFLPSLHAVPIYCDCYAQNAFYQDILGEKQQEANGNSVQVGVDGCDGEDRRWLTVGWLEYLLPLCL